MALQPRCHGVPGDTGRVHDLVPEATQPLPYECGFYRSMGLCEQAFRCGERQVHLGQEEEAVLQSGLKILEEKVRKMSSNQLSHWQDIKSKGLANRKDRLAA